MTSSLQFHERMAGWVSFDEHSFNQAARDGHLADQGCSHSLEIEIDDLDRFFTDPAHTGHATGHVRCDALGGRYDVCAGSTFNLFVSTDTNPRHKRMVYRLLLLDADGRALTLIGFKQLHDDQGLDIWPDTTRLFVRLIAGHVHDDPIRNDRTVATGILYISHFELVRMLGSFRGNRGLRGLRNIGRFGRFFAENLVEAYTGPALSIAGDDFPAPGPLDIRWHGHPPGEWHDLPYHPGLRRRIVGFAAADPERTQLTLHHIRGAREPDRGVVLLVHGGGVRANLFYGSPGPTLARALVDAGYDVWVENWRASIDLPASQYTLDQGAAYDHPAAVAAIRKLTGARTLGAVVQCQGSTSLTMAAIAGLVPAITTVVSNAVSLHVDVPLSSKIKLHLFVPPCGLRLAGLDAQWVVRAPTALAHSVAGLAHLIRGADCDNEICQFANYMYGVGPDILWKHANLDAATHQWVSREFGFCPFSLLRQIGQAQRRGYIAPVAGLPQLPASLIDHAPQTDARFTFLAGTDNRLFLPSSQRRAFEHFDRYRPGYHAHHELPGYTHLDVMFGRSSSREVFPVILDALARDSFVY